MHMLRNDHPALSSLVSTAITMNTIFDLLYPAFWVCLAAIGLGLASRTWTKKTGQAFAKLQAADEHRAEQLQIQLTQRLNEIETSTQQQTQTHQADLLMRIDQAHASANARDAQLRSQLAQRHAEFESAMALQAKQTQDLLSQRLAEIETSTQQQTQTHQADLLMRIDQVHASANTRDAQLRSQLAQRHAEFESAMALQAQQTQDLLSQRLIEIEATSAQQVQQHHAEVVSKLEQFVASPNQVSSVASPAESPDQRRRMDRLLNDIDFVKNHMSSYLGGGAGLTHLVDETPIYINTNDFGCPSNFINGGRYEEEYYQVLASFRRPYSVFLDIGANLGVFSLRLAPLLRKGKIFAFEPNSTIHELFSRSVHLNGLKQLINIFNFGVSDKNVELALAVPEGHAGGASVCQIDKSYTGPRIQVRRIDDVLADLAGFDLAKIDVEGHELHALQGMDQLLQRSGNAVILFEKLNAHSGIEAALIEFFSKYDMRVYRIDGVTLVDVDEAQFNSSEAYFLAARAQTIDGAMQRNFINLFPDDFYAIASEVKSDSLVAQANLAPNNLIFHGPYWYLPRGSYDLLVIGQINGSFKLSIAEKFGFPIAEFAVSSESLSFNLIVENDLTHFECVGRADDGITSFSIQCIRLTRLG
jgi:FkbM family methyltransferase